MKKIGVIDYGMGNLHSLAKALERVAPSQRVLVTYDPEELLDCDRLVLPGVGGVRECMKELQRLELAQLVREASRKVAMRSAAPSTPPRSRPPLHATISWRSSFIPKNRRFRASPCSPISCTGIPKSRPPDPFSCRACDGAVL